jgi:phage gpG-like protein
MTADIFYNFQADDNFSYLAQELARPTNVLRAFASYRKSAFAQSIALGRDPYGREYAPLSDRYRQWKERKYGRRVILSRSGAMLRSHRVRVEGDRIVESVNAPGIYHQEGTKKMPRRMILPDAELGMPARDQEKLLGLFVKAIEQGARRN